MEELRRAGEAVMGFFAQHGLRLLTILALMAVMAGLIRLGRRLFVRYYLGDLSDLSERQKRANTLGRILEVSGLVLVVVMGALMMIEEAGIDIKPILASLGIGGIAVGFGAQSLVKDVISGFFILMEDQIRVGDVVEVADRSGMVEKVGLRALVLREVSGNRVIVPNSQVTVVVNMTYEYSRAVLDVAVAYKEDVDRVVGVIERVGAELREDERFRDAILEPLEVLGLERFDDSAVVIRARIKTKPVRQWEVRREFNRRIKQAFDREGIEIPFPQRTVHLAGRPAPGPD